MSVKTLEIREETPVERRLLSMTETAQVLGISRSKAYELAATGDLPCIKIGALRRISVAALDEWIACLAEEEEPDDAA